MIQYLIQVVAFQLLFLLAYDLFLKKETFFNWNRVYLICSSFISFVIPFIKIESFQNAVPQEYIEILPEIVLTPETAVEAIAPSWNWYLIIGITISSLLFIYKIVQLLRLRFKGRFVKRENYTAIMVPKSTMAFSIFNYVFIGDDIDAIKLEDILSHELVHIREKHSIDLLYFELLRILCWFNPLVYIYQKRISEVHEYIADASVANKKNKSDYYEKLLAEVFQTQHFSFTNQFFKHSLIKKRIIMLTKQKSRQILKLKYLVLVPVLIVSLFYTSCKNSTILDSAENIEAVNEIVENNEFDIFQTEPIDFKMVDRAPVFPNCKDEKTAESLKKCFIRSVQIHVNKTFNTKLANELGLEGKRIKLEAEFVIDENGEVADMKVEAENPEFKTEVKRVLKALPKLMPAMKDGNPVSVKYLLPIVFKVH